MTTEQAPLVFLVDIDNTLLDHDLLKKRLGAWVAGFPGGDVELFWRMYEEVREETGIVDLFETSRRYGDALEQAHLIERMQADLWGFPLADLVYPATADALRHLETLGLLVVLCDGHEPYQRHKLEVSGLAPFFGGRILVFDHKETYVPEIVSRYPAEHYVMLDDRPRIHDAMRRHLGLGVTTVLVRQGTHGQAPHDPRLVAPDITVTGLEELSRFSSEELRASARALDTVDSRRVRA